MENAEKLKTFVEESNLFTDEPIHDFVDEGYFGYLKREHINEIRESGPGEEPFAGMGVCDKLYEPKEFIAEIGISDQIAFSDPKSVGQSVLPTLLKRVAVELNAEADEVPGPEGGRPCIQSAIPIKIYYRAPVGELGETNPVLTIKLRLRATRVGP